MLPTIKKQNISHQNKKPWLGKIDEILPELLIFKADLMHLFFLSEEVQIYWMEK